MKQPTKKNGLKTKPERLYCRGAETGRNRNEAKDRDTVGYLVLHGIPQVVVGVGVVRLEPQGSPVAVYRLLRVSYWMPYRLRTASFRGDKKKQVKQCVAFTH